MHHRFSQHALEEMAQRSINKDVVEAILSEPQQIVPERAGLVAYQSIVDFEDKGVFLVRVIINPMTDPEVVVTVYRTSKINKYWRTP
ncbi:MAG: DUF4258 domain-containing protein [Magnetococcales bacterium]|nr:DUF4258 domain-containing protein [Magnetococcales bacterium]